MDDRLDSFVTSAIVFPLEDSSFFVERASLREENMSTKIALRLLGLTQNFLVILLGAKSLGFGGDIEVLALGGLHLFVKISCRCRALAVLRSLRRGFNFGIPGLFCRSRSARRFFVETDTALLIPVGEVLQFLLLHFVLILSRGPLLGFQGDEEICFVAVPLFGRLGMF